MTLHPVASGDNPYETEGGPSYMQQRREHLVMNEHVHLGALQTT